MKKIAFYILALLLTAYIVAAFVFTRAVDKQAVCKGIKITIEKYDSGNFVTDRFISSELRKMGINPAGQKVQDVKLKDIEELMLQKDYIENVQCYALTDNYIMLDIVPLKPVLRVFADGKSFYVNKDNKSIKSNEKFFIDVPVVAGNFSEKFPPTRLLPLLNYIEENKHLKSLVSLVEVKDSANIFIIPNLNSHIINLGDVNDFESKFKKLDRMYKEVLPIKGWNYYDTISLKWDHQIVATRRKTASRLNITAATDDDDEKEDDIETMTGSNAPSHTNN